MSAERIAVVLFNLGGPDSLPAVKPFLRNLFSDPAIIRLPGPIRWLLARVIAARRAATAREIYRQMGGRSPIVPETEAQARALTVALKDLGEVEVVIAMRYWAPRAAEAAAAVKQFRPDRVVLLPLYPQFSTTTTASSFDDWFKAAGAAGLAAETISVCCYPEQPGLAEALAWGCDNALDELGISVQPRLGPALRGTRRPRLLFSAHGLPEKIIAAGDPYQAQVEATVDAVRGAMQHTNYDPVICYQSRVGPMKWLGPSTDTEIERAGRDKVPVIVAPVAFVSEHSETLVELDIEYRHLAEQSGVPRYLRVPTVGVTQPFIDGLADVVRGAVAGKLGRGVVSACARRWCPAHFAGCRCST